MSILASMPVYVHHCDDRDPPLSLALSLNPRVDMLDQAVCEARTKATQRYVHGILEHTKVIDTKIQVLGAPAKGREGAAQRERAAWRCTAPHRRMSSDDPLWRLVVGHGVRGTSTAALERAFHGAVEGGG